MKFTIAATVFIPLAALFALRSTVHAQPPTKSIWDGVFTEAQATRGKALYAENCASCHGEDGKGNREVGAPNLTDQHWVYGGDLQTIINTIHGGRQGHMPTWDERLTPAEIKILSLYVASLGTKQP